MQPASEAAFFLLRQQQQQQQQQQSLFTTPNPLYIPLGSHKSASSGGTGHTSGQLTSAICPSAIATVPSAVAAHATGGLKQQHQHQQQAQHQQQQIAASMLNGHSAPSSSAHDHQPMMLNGLNSRNSDRVPSPSSSVTTAPLSMHALNLHNRVMEMQYQQQSHHHLTPYNNQYIIPSINHQHHSSTLNAATSASNGYHLYQNGNHLSHHPYLAGPTIDNCLSHAIYTSGSSHQPPQLQQQQSQPVSSLYHGNVNGNTPSTFNGQVMHLPVMNGNNSVVDGTAPTAISSSAAGSTGYRILNQSQQQQQQSQASRQVNLQSRNVTSRVQNHSSSVGAFFHANANGSSQVESSSSLFTHTNHSGPLLPNSNNTINGPAESTMNGSNGRSFAEATVRSGGEVSMVNGHHQSLRESSNTEDTRGEPLLLASLDTSSTTSSMKFRQKKKKKPSPFKPPPAVFQMQLFASTGGSFNPFAPSSVDCTAVTSSTSTSAVAGGVIASSHCNDLSNILSDILNNGCSSNSRSHQHYSSTSSGVKSKSSLTHSPPPPPPPPPISERPRPPPPPQASVSRKCSGLPFSGNSTGAPAPATNGHHVYTNESATAAATTTGAADQHSSSSSGSYSNHRSKCSQVPSNVTVNSDKSGNNASPRESASSPKQLKQIDCAVNGQRKASRSHSPIDERPKCFYCAALIKDEECTEAEGGFYHIKCFACTSCHRTLGGLQYIMHSPGVTSNTGNSSSSGSTLTKEPYCTECFDSLFGEYCEGCGQLIQVGTVEAITHEGRKWHAVDACFNCHNCNQSLLGLPFLPHSSGLIFCSDECSREAFTFARVKQQYQSNKKMDKEEQLLNMKHDKQVPQYNIQQVHCEDEASGKSERKNVKSSLCSSSSSSSPSTSSTPANNVLEKASDVHLPPPPSHSPGSLHSFISDCDSHHQINHLHQQRQQQQVHSEHRKQVITRPGDHRKEQQQLKSVLRDSHHQSQAKKKSEQIKCSSADEQNESAHIIVNACDSNKLSPAESVTNENNSLYSSINLLFKNKKGSRAKDKSSKCELHSTVDESTEAIASTALQVPAKSSGKSKSDTSRRKKVSHDVKVTEQQDEHQEEKKKVNCSPTSETLVSEETMHQQWINDAENDDDDDDDDVENGSSVKCKQFKSSSKLSHNNYIPRKSACGQRNDSVKMRQAQEEKDNSCSSDEMQIKSQQTNVSNGYIEYFNGTNDDINLNRKNLQSEIITRHENEKCEENETSAHTSPEVTLRRSKVASECLGGVSLFPSQVSSEAAADDTPFKSAVSESIVDASDALADALKLTCIEDTSNDNSISSASLSTVSHPDSSSPPLPPLGPHSPPKETTAITANNHHKPQLANEQEMLMIEKKMKKKQSSPQTLLDRPRINVHSDKELQLTKQTDSILNESEKGGGKVNAAFKKDEGSSSESNNNKQGEEEEEDVYECQVQRAATKQEVKASKSVSFDHTMIENESRKSRVRRVKSCGINGVSTSSGDKCHSSDTKCPSKSVSKRRHSHSHGRKSDRRSGRRHSSSSSSRRRHSRRSRHSSGGSDDEEDETEKEEEDDEMEGETSCYSSSASSSSSSCSTCDSSSSDDTDCEFEFNQWISGAEVARHAHATAHHQSGHLQSPKQSLITHSNSSPSLQQRGVKGNAAIANASQSTVATAVISDDIEPVYSVPRGHRATVTSLSRVSGSSSVNSATCMPNVPLRPDIKRQQQQCSIQ